MERGEREGERATRFMGFLEIHSLIGYMTWLESNMVHHNGLHSFGFLCKILVLYDNKRENSYSMYFNKKLIKALTRFSPH